MGSRIMHSIIAKKVADRLNIEDKSSFLIGGIAADASSNKDASHFYKGSLQSYSRTIDYEGFLEKYKQHKRHPYIQGYFAHLIADDLWLTGFFVPWLKNRMEQNAALHPLYHNDFRLLNSKLLYHYGLKEELEKYLNMPTSMMDLEEVHTSDVTSFISYVLGDMKDDPANIEKDLHVFSMDQIIGYIETSIEKSVYLLEQIHVKTT